MKIEKYDQDYYVKAFKSNIQKGLCLAVFLFSSRKFLVSSFVIFLIIH